MKWTLDQKIATVGVATYFIANEAEKQVRQSGHAERAKTLASLSCMGAGVAFGSMARQIITKTLVLPDLGLLGTAALVGVGVFVFQKMAQSKVLDAHVKGEFAAWEPWEHHRFERGHEHEYEHGHEREHDEHEHERREDPFRR